MFDRSSVNPFLELVDVADNTRYELEAAPSHDPDTKNWDFVRKPHHVKAGHDASEVVLLNPGRLESVGLVGAWSTSITDWQGSPDAKGPYSFGLVEMANRNFDLGFVAVERFGEPGATNLSSAHRERLLEEGSYAATGSSIARLLQRSLRPSGPRYLMGMSEGGRELLGVAASGDLSGTIDTLIMVDPVGVKDMRFQRLGLFAGFAAVEGIKHQSRYLRAQTADPIESELMTRTPLHRAIPEMLGRWYKHGSLGDNLLVRTKAMAQAGLERDLQDALKHNPDLKIVWISAEHSAVADHRSAVDIYNRLDDKQKARVKMLKAPGAHHSSSQAHTYVLAQNLKRLIRLAAK